MARKLIPAAAVLVALGVTFLQEHGLFPDALVGGADRVDSGEGYRPETAFANRESDVQVRGHGTVAKVLPDDLKGSRHQRFILRLESGHSLLVAHNIDLAPRIANLRAGDRVGFAGEYEWNEKGGVLHWTHHDPRGVHPGGWLEHAGRTYR